MSTPRSPWQRLYAWAHRRRRRYWATRAAALGRPTVSIGNLHWGGSGKTPTAIAVARGLAARGLRVAVLSRGYRRRGREPLLVSRGDGLLAAVDAAGDEPAMISEQAPDAVVLVGADRRATAALALEQAPDIDIFLLDDGFSHVRVRRDVEVLTFPAVDPLAGGLLLPSGRLREPLEQVRAADAAVLTGAAEDSEPPEHFEDALRRNGFRGPVFLSTLHAELVGGSLPGRPLLVTGVARPERVVGTAAAAGLACVDHLRFADHHGYPRRSLRAIEAACARHRCDAVVTTSKDAVKLRGRLPEEAPPLLELRVETRPDPEFLPWLVGRLSA